MHVQNLGLDITVFTGSASIQFTQQQSGWRFQKKTLELSFKSFRAQKNVVVVVVVRTDCQNKGLLFSVENVPCEHLQSISRVTDHCTVMSSLNSECIQEMPKSIKTNKAFYYRRYRQQKKRENTEVGC